LRDKLVIVGNLPTTDGTFGTIGRGCTPAKSLNSAWKASLRTSTTSTRVRAAPSALDFVREGSFNYAAIDDVNNSLSVYRLDEPSGQSIAPIRCADVASRRRSALRNLPWRGAAPRPFALQSAARPT
jgi:hypothetical protein